MTAASRSVSKTENPGSSPGFPAKTYEQHRASSTHQNCENNRFVDYPEMAA